MNSIKYQPLVSVIINCYNGEKYLSKAIDSVYSQTYNNWEIIFWDNCSTDKSHEIILRYDNKIKYYRSESNINLGKARKLAINKCSGKFVAFLDVDDYWHPNKLEIQIQKMITHNTILSYTGCYIIDENDTIIKTYKPKEFNGFHFSNLLTNFDINLPATILNLEVLIQKNLNFDEEIYGSEEYDLFMQIAADHDITVINLPLCYYRISNSSLTNQTLMYRAADKIKTFRKLEIKYPILKQKFNKKWMYAYNKIFYYKMQNYIHLNEKYLALSEINKIRFTHYKYFFVWICVSININIYKYLLRKYDLRGI